jgi:hypothetical protein
MMMQSSLFLGVAKLALTVLICLSFLQVVTARADFINGDQLRLYCTSKNPNDEAVCFVYIAGAVDAFTTIDLMGEKASGTKRQFCLPDGISPDQLKDTTMTWLARPEANLDLAATLLIWGAIKDAYGCR